MRICRSLTACRAACKGLIPHRILRGCVPLALPAIQHGQATRTLKRQRQQLHRLSQQTGPADGKFGAGTIATN
ncbi:hypothetical protein GC176_15700 [bacterium]|nr:hypothetical protein [bacterium]